MKIAYFGDKNSHTSHAASLLYSGADIEKIGFSTVRACFSAVNNGQADALVAPIENNVEGTVNETVDSLLENSLYIQSEIIEKIDQSLIVYKGTKKEDITEIFSHPQALSQCRIYLEKNFINANIQAAANTSAAIEKVNNKSVAAIGRTAINDNQEILFSAIQDNKDNATRFISLTKKPSFEGNKCSIVFDTANEPGALLKVLNVFAGEKINMTKIESRPAKTVLGRYNFFVDFNYGGRPDGLNQLLGAIQNYTSFLKFLGCYQSYQIK